MIEILIGLWLIGGFISVWRLYHGLLKYWWESFNYSYWDGEGNVLIQVIFTSPLFIINGWFSLFLTETLLPTTWWFTTKNKK